MQKNAKSILLFIVAILAALICCDSQNECKSSDRKPLFVKLYKVGSESFSRVVIKTMENGFDYFNRTRCGEFSSPVDHSMVKKYMGGGLEYLKSCNMENSCANLIVILREPMERVMSQLSFYYVSEFSHRFQKQFLKMSDGRVIDATYRKFLNNSLSITVDDMKLLLKGSRSMPFLDNQIDLYEKVLSRDSKSENRVFVALSNLQHDFHCVGLTESMPSFYALYAKMFHKPIEKTCVADMKHGMGAENKKRYNSAKRPNAKKLLLPDTYDYLRQQLSGEYKLWEKAQEMHTKQLLANGMGSMEDASKLWEKACPRLYFYDRQLPTISKKSA